MNTLRSLMAGILMLLAFITVTVPALAAVDTTQPTTSATLAGTKGSDGWYTTSVTVTLAATDGADGSGVAKTEYSLDNVTWQTYSAPFVLDKDGDQYVYFQSTDLAGNVETPSKVQEIKINKTGLVGLWHMDNDWKDASVAGNNGAPNGGATFSSNAKIGTGAGSFDGIDDYVLIGSQVPLTLQIQNEISLEAWIFLTQYPSDLGLIVGSQYDGNYAGATIFIDGRTNPDGQTAPPGHIHFQIGNGAWHASNTKTQVPLNQWVHIVATRKANEDAKIYYNGILQPLTSVAWSGAISYTGAWFAIGQQKNVNRPFKGTLDEVALYNRALSDTEIQQHYRVYVQPNTSATLTGTKGSDGWYTTSVTVALAAANGADGSGVAKTEYSLDNVTWQTYSTPFVFDKDGGQYVYFRSTDLAGNVETPSKVQEIKINKTGLVGLWHMDNDWKDASVAGNNGAPNGGATFSSNAKIGIGAGSFDGIDDYVLIGSQVPLTLQIQNEISLEAWIFLTQYPSDLGLIVGSQYDGNYAGATIFIDGRTNPDGQTAPPGHIHFQIGNGAWHASNTKTQVPLNQWVHIVATRKANEDAKIYYNGILQPLTSVAWSGAISYTGAWFAIGQQKGLNRPFKGTLDEVALYNRALSDTEIQQHYSNYVQLTVNLVPSPTKNSTITLSGTKPANTAIVVNGNTLVPLDGTTSWQTNYTLSQGNNTISVIAQYSQNSSNLPVTQTVILPVTLTVVLDTMPPQVTATTPTNNGIVKTAPAALTFTLADALSSLDFTATLNGAMVTNTSGSKVSGTWSSAGSGTTGSVTFTPSAALSEGQYTATIKPTDTLGNGSNYTLNFTIDSTPPVAPGIDPVTAPINATSKTITGTKSSDSATVVVSCAGATTGTISSPTATTWNVNVSGLKEGSNTITAYAVDTAGNLSATTTATITVDTTPPAVGATPAGGIYILTQSVALAANEPAVIYYTTDGSTPTASATMYSQPISIPEGVTLKYFAKDLAGNNSEIKTENYVIDATPPVLAISTLSDGAYTNNDTLNITGTVTDNSGVKGFTVNDTAVQVNADGSFSYALLLKNGVNSITVAATDIAGNKATETRAVTLDQTAPLLVVTTPADNSKTGKALLEVSGTVDETSAVTVKMKDNIQNAVMNDGAFTATIVLEPGYNTIDITAADLAGNQSTLKRTVVFDDQMPSLALTMPNQDIRTNQKSLTIKGTAHDALTAVGVKISKDNEIFTLPVIDGTFEQEVNFTEEKTYGIIVTATNEVGTSTSVQRNIIYDITPPVLSIDPVHSPTSHTCLSATGTRETGTAVTVTCATAKVVKVSYPTATTWQADISGLTEGENVITAASADAAGNAVTTTATVVLDTKRPQITITATPDVIWPPNHKMVPVKITGGVEANGSNIKSVSISVKDDYGKYEYNNLTFGSTVKLEAWRNGHDTDGRKYTITVVVTDRWGITTEKTATVTVPHDMSNQKKVKKAPKK